VSRLVQLVADYGPGELAYAELLQLLALTVPDAVVHVTTVAPSDTVAAGFCVAQLALTEGPPNRVVVHDVGSPEAGGGLLCAGRTRDGVWIVGRNSGCSWSFVIDELPSLCHLDVTTGGSRLCAPQALAAAITHLIRGHPHAIRDVMPRSSIPAAPSRAVAYIDAAGDIKTTLTEPPGAVGARVQVRIGRVSGAAIITDGNANVPRGELGLATGSSGWPTRSGGRRRFVELFVGGGSAAERFARPPGGTAIALSTVAAARGDCGARAPS
jgi:hypothetical protein